MLFNEHAFTVLFLPTAFGVNVLPQQASVLSARPSLFCTLGSPFATFIALPGLYGRSEARPPSQMHDRQDSRKKERVARTATEVRLSELR